MEDEISGEAQTPWRLIRKVWLKILALLPGSRFPTLTMTNAQGALLEHGFYSGYLEDISPKWSLEVMSTDRKLREKIFSDDFIDHSELNAFLIKLGLGIHEQNRALLLLKEFIQRYYPSSLLEAIPQNMKQGLQALQPFKKRTLISSSGRCSRSSYVTAAAKQTGLTIIDCQHGGHEGYIEDVSANLELEYPGVDQLVSWGWSRLPDHPAVKGLSVIDLPSPWLSERKRYWVGLNLGGEREYDFLLMPNMVKRFPAAPHGASISRIDLVRKFAASLKHLVRKVSFPRFLVFQRAVFMLPVFSHAEQ